MRKICAEVLPHFNKSARAHTWVSFILKEQCELMIFFNIAWKYWVMFLNILYSFKKNLIDSFEDFLVDQDRQFQNTQIWGETVSDFFGHKFTPVYTAIKKIKMCLEIYSVCRYRILGMQIWTFSKTPHIQKQFLERDPVFKYEFLVLFIYPCCVKFCRVSWPQLHW